MKIKLQREYDDWGDVRSWSEGGDTEVDLPDAIIADWRATTKHLEELETYFNERAQPQIDAAEHLRREAWRKRNPEAAARNDTFAKIRLKHVNAGQSFWNRFLEARTETLSMFTEKPAQKAGDTINYAGKDSDKG